MRGPALQVGFFFATLKSERLIQHDERPTLRVGLSFLRGATMGKYFEKKRRYPRRLREAYLRNQAIKASPTGATYDGAREYIRKYWTFDPWGYYAFRNAKLVAIHA
jgi:hypothetical protein